VDVGQLDCSNVQHGLLPGCRIAWLPGGWWAVRFMGQPTDTPTPRPPRPPPGGKLLFCFDPYRRSPFRVFCAL